MASTNLDNSLKSFDYDESKQPKLPNEFIGASFNNDAKTGVSKFHLATMDGENPVVLTGLLTELPEISFTVNYEDGPGNEWQDTIANFTGNGLMQMVNALGSANQGSNWKNLIKAGTWTKKVYNGYSISSIPLKFRIYSSDTLGQSSANDWFVKLSKFAAISKENLMEPGKLLQNAFAAVANVTDAGGRAAENDAMLNLLKNFFNSNNSIGTDSESNQAAYERDKLNNENAMATFRKAVASCQGEKFKLQIISGNGFIGAVTNLFNGGSADTNRCISLSYISGKRLAKAEIGHIMDPSIEPKDYKGGTQRPFTLNEVIKAINNLNPDSSDFEYVDDQKIWEKIKKTLLEEINKLEENNSNHSDYESFTKNIKLLGELANSAGEFLVEKFNQYRVVNPFNKNNALGEKLWYLYLYEDVIFKKNDPLIVYISDWTYQPSEEYDLNLGTGIPVYYEFTVNCVLDQVYSRDVWNKKLYRG